MASKINVTERIAIIIEKQKIEVVTTLNYDMSISFDNKDTAPTLNRSTSAKLRQFPKMMYFSPH
ncbi:phage protein [Streptococcus pneumoniae]|nr:phage protein [Streptococcus pneumoniae]